MKNPAWIITISGYEISLTQLSVKGNSYRVVYGLQIKNNLTYAEACKEIGSAIMHALTLEGKLDV